MCTAELFTPYSSDLCQFTQMRNYRLFLFLTIQTRDNIMHIYLKEYNQGFFKGFSTLRYFIPHLLIYSLKFKCAALYSAVICKRKISSQSSPGLILASEPCSIWAFFWQSWSKELVFTLLNSLVPSSGERRHTTAHDYGYFLRHMLFKNSHTPKPRHEGCQKIHTCVILLISVNGLLSISLANHVLNVLTLPPHHPRHHSVDLLYLFCKE